MRVTYTLSKSMNNLGEAFFSAPTDPTNVMKDWGRSDNDQRHRLVVSASVNSPTTPATTLWEHLAHGFQASTMLQYYSSLPFNIVSGVNSLQGTAGRPFADGSASTANFDVRAVEFIPRNAGNGSDFFTVGLRVSRSFRLPGGSRRSQGLVEAFNLTNRVNAITRNTTFGPGSFPNPGVVVQHRHRGRRSADAAVRRAVVVLRQEPRTKGPRNQGTKDRNQPKPVDHLSWSPAWANQFRQ